MIDGCLQFINFYSHRNSLNNRYLQVNYLNLLNCIEIVSFEHRPDGKKKGINNRCQ